MAKEKEVAKREEWLASANRSFWKTTKIMMVSALVVSVLFAFSGNIPVHVLAGFIFLLFLLLHGARHSGRLFS